MNTATSPADQREQRAHREHRALAHDDLLQSSSATLGRIAISGSAPELADAPLCREHGRPRLQSHQRRGHGARRESCCCTWSGQPGAGNNARDPVPCSASIDSELMAAVHRCCGWRDLATPLGLSA